MNAKEWITEKEFSFHRIETLVALLVGASVTLIGGIFPVIKDYFPQWWIHLILLFAIDGVIIFYWYRNRSVFPKCSSEKGNIIIAIITENAKQKTRITHDFKKEIEAQLKNHNLDLKYTVTVLHNHLSRITQNKINLYFKSKKAGIENSKSAEDFNKLKKKLNAKFIIYGDLIERNASNNTYCLSLEAMMCHASVSREGSMQLHSEFKNLWKKEITFLEENELTGFKENAEYVFFTSSYMIGLATFIDNNYLHGIEIWEGLERFISDKSDLLIYKDKIKQLKATSYFLQSRLAYFDGKIADSVILREKYHAIFPNEYNSCLNEAINHVKLRDDPERALEFINRAEKIAPENDGVWRYNKFYLLIRTGKMDEAITILDEILSFSFTNEIDVINQVVSYNQTCLRDDPSHIQTYFIVGTLIYKKLKQPIPSYDKIEEFIKRTEHQESWMPLNKKAKEYLAELDNIIGIRTV